MLHIINHLLCSIWQRCRPLSTLALFSHVSQAHSLCLIMPMLLKVTWDHDISRLRDSQLFVYHLSSWSLLKKWFLKITMCDSLCFTIKIDSLRWLSSCTQILVSFYISCVACVVFLLKLHILTADNNGIFLVKLWEKHVTVYRRVKKCLKHISGNYKL